MAITAVCKLKTILNKSDVFIDIDNTIYTYIYISMDVLRITYFTTVRASDKTETRLLLDLCDQFRAHFMDDNASSRALWLLWSSNSI
jgi:hypothetical protein